MVEMHYFEVDTIMVPERDDVSDEFEVSWIRQKIKNVIIWYAMLNEMFVYNII